MHSSQWPAECTLTYKVEQKVSPMFLQQAPHIFAGMSICTMTVALCQQTYYCVLSEDKIGLESFRLT